MSILRSMFGPSRGEVWGELAQRLDGDYTDGGFFKGGKLVVDFNEWSITLDTYTVSTNNSSTTYTRMRAPYVNADGFRFRIYRKSIFSGVGKWFGMQDIEIGDPVFDDPFIIQGNNEALVRRFLARAELRELFLTQPSVDMSVKDDEGWFGAKFPEGVDELHFLALGVIKDIPRLEDLFDLFATSLDQLCHIGSAYEDDPGLVL